MLELELELVELELELGLELVAEPRLLVRHAVSEVASGALRAVLAVMAALAVAFVPMDGAEA